MGYTHGISWSEAEILKSVKICMEDIGLSRMPSRSELNEYFGDSRLTNAIRRFPGGYYKVAELLGVQMKDSETQFGKSGEEHAVSLLRERGFEVERMSTKYAYDLYVNGSVKVDVKTARLSKVRNSECYSFNLEKRFPTCDVYFLIARCEDKEAIYIVPSSINQTQIGIGKVNTIYSRYLNRYDIIKKMDDVFQSTKAF